MKSPPVHLQHCAVHIQLFLLNTNKWYLSSEKDIWMISNTGISKPDICFQDSFVVQVQKWQTAHKAFINQRLLFSVQYILYCTDSEQHQSVEDTSNIVID